MAATKKFRMTKELMQDMDGPGKALAAMCGMPMITMAIDAPETVVSVVEDVAGAAGRAWSSIFGN